MSAISTLLLGVLKTGDKVLSQANLYGGTTDLLKNIFGQFGVETVFVNLRNPEEVDSAFRNDPAIKMLYCETPANPTLACVDIQALSDVAHKYGAWCAIDNTFATPYLQQPFAFGVDFIIHSTTKFLNGHGNSIAGVILEPVQGLTGARDLPVELIQAARQACDIVQTLDHVRLPQWPGAIEDTGMQSCDLDA